METILIADHQQIVRRGLRVLIESLPSKYHVFEASTCAEAKQMLLTLDIQYIISDMFLADGSILSAIHQLMNNRKKTTVLIYSMIDEKIYARRLVQKGVRGFVSKDAPLSELENALRCFLNGDIYLSQRMQEYLLMPPIADSLVNPIDSLSDRELEVVEYVITGMELKEIAEILKRDITTVSTYRRRAYQKLGVHNIIELKDKYLLYKMQG